MKSWSFENPSLLRSLLVLASALSLGPGAFAQSGTNFITSNHALKVDVDLVTLSFSVKDKNRRYVGNLSKEDVVLLEDEILQEIAYFEFEPMPVSLVVLVPLCQRNRNNLTYCLGPPIPSGRGCGDCFFRCAILVPGIHSQQERGIHWSGAGLPEVFRSH